MNMTTNGKEYHQPITLVIANQKGGVGKTATAKGLAELLAKTAKVLAVDLDQQGHLTMALGGNKEVNAGAYEVLTGKAKIGDALQGISKEEEEVEGGCLHLLPGTIALARFHKEEGSIGIEKALIKRVIQPLSAMKYDYVIIDTPPALGLTNTVALTACKNGGVIIPAFPDRFSEDGIIEFSVTVEEIRENYNEDLKVLGILITNHNPQTNLGKAFIERYEQLAENIGTKVFNSCIHRNIKLSEAVSLANNIEEYRKTAPKLLKDYEDFISEVLTEVGKE